VKFHLSNVYRKIAVSNRTEASRWAELHGLLGTQVA
jgi:DNA-binding CsgD family transcriptional regulator